MIRTGGGKRARVGQHEEKMSESGRTTESLRPLGRHWLQKGLRLLDFHSSATDGL